MATVDVDDSCQFSADSQHKSTGLAWFEGWRPPGAQSRTFFQQLLRQQLLLIDWRLSRTKQPLWCTL